MGVGGSGKAGCVIGIARPHTGPSTNIGGIIIILVCTHTHVGVRKAVAVRAIVGQGAPARKAQARVCRKAELAVTT